MKTLEQIQEENRKAIIKAISPDAKLINGLFFEPERADGSEYCDQIIIPFTLDRVLRALQSQEIGFLDGYLFELEDKGYDGMVEQWICKWDLTKETLEEQEEATQRAINDLLSK